MKRIVLSLMLVLALGLIVFKIESKPKNSYVPSLAGDHLDENFTQPIVLGKVTSEANVLPDNQNFKPLCPAGLPGFADKVHLYSATPNIKQDFHFTSDWAIVDSYVYQGTEGKEAIGPGFPYGTTGTSSEIFSTEGGKFTFRSLPYVGQWGEYPFYYWAFIYTHPIKYNQKPMDLSMTLDIKWVSANGFVGFALGSGEADYRQIAFLNRPDGTFDVLYMADCSLIVVKKNVHPGMHKLELKPLVTHWQALLDDELLFDDAVGPPSLPRFKPGYVALVADGRVAGEVHNISFHTLQ